MTSTLETVLATAGDVRLTVRDLLRHQHQLTRLDSLVREALLAKLVETEARKFGITVSPEELQAAADHFRRRQGHQRASDTRAWLERNQLSVADFEAGLEQGLLVNRLRRHVTSGQVESHFDAHRQQYDRLSLRQMILPREDLASELASQVRDEGRALDDVAREQGLEMPRLEVLRKQLLPALVEALTGTQPGELVGPVATPRGFHLVLVEEVVPAEPTPDLRERISHELFDAWLAAKLEETTLDLSPGSI